MHSGSRRSRAILWIVLGGLIAFPAESALADRFILLTGIDARHWPGQRRDVTPQPGPGFDGEFFDGDRLAGTSDIGPIVEFVGSGTPFFQPNEFGAGSFIFKRASVPVGGLVYPLMGIDFLGGPRLDLDGDTANDSRKLVPKSGMEPIETPGPPSFIDMNLDVAGGVISLESLDATGTSEGGPFINAAVAVTVNVLAGTSTNGEPGAAINPGIDDRSGTLTSYAGAGGDLVGVYHVESLGYEIWQDTLLAGSATSDELGTFQYAGVLAGWYVQRDSQTGVFPILAGEGLGSTQWPAVNTSYVGQVFNTAIASAGLTATIRDGGTTDKFDAPNNGGLALTDFGGDLGAYLDAVVVPRIDADSDAFIYLSSAGFGINNSSDPIYYDAIGHDVVIIAQAARQASGDADGDGDVDLADAAAFQRCGTTFASCEALDFDFDGDVDLVDWASFAGKFSGPSAP